MLQPTDRTRRKQGFLADDGGFGFIDLMLALVVLTIGVLALADLQIVAKKSNTSSSSMMSAITIAETQMETIKGTTYGNIVASGPTPITGTTFTQQVQVTPNSPVANSKTVKVIITWTDNAGATHTVPMSTVVAQ